MLGTQVQNVSETFWLAAADGEVEDAALVEGAAEVEEDGLPDEQPAATRAATAAAPAIAVARRVGMSFMVSPGRRNVRDYPLCPEPSAEVWRLMLGGICCERSQS
jgi:hypothetical protein